MNRPVSLGSILLLVALLALPAPVVARQESSTPVLNRLLPAESSSAPILGFQLVSPRDGWLLAGSALYWTSDAGSTWKEITPAVRGVIQAAFFTTPQSGWVILTAPSEEVYILAQTMDAGQTWRSQVLNLFEPGDPAAIASHVYLQFRDEQNGWLVVKQATGSTFSRGTLFLTSDGGSTWEPRSLPAGDPVVFSSPMTGFLAGGAAGDEFYRTMDTGVTWERVTVGSLAEGERRFYHSPRFINPLIGYLPTVVAGAGDSSRLEVFQTRDSGWTWRLESAARLDASLVPNHPLPFAVTGADRWRIALPGTSQLVDRAALTNRASLPGSDSSAGKNAPVLTTLDMIDSTSGWALEQTGWCTDETCTQQSRLLATSDGGQTWSPLTLPQNGALNPTAILTQAATGQAFDVCALLNANQMATWYTSSPYRTRNLYMGGSAMADCGTLTAAYVAQMAAQGWKFIPTWVGPQASCGYYKSKMSSDPATAYNQGKAEADLATEAAYNLGLTLPNKGGTIIYYDLEAYPNSDTACREAAKAFINGWTYQLHARGNSAGVYGATCASKLTDFSTITHVPDAIWPAVWLSPNQYRPDASTTDLLCLSNALWSNHQRIRQYAGGHSENWGGVSITIDSNVVDGVIARQNGFIATNWHYLPAILRFR